MASTTPELKEARVVFSCGSKDYTVRDVIDAAHFRGELEPLWSGLLAGVKAEEMARETDLELDDAELDSAAIAFRYQYDLITAEETEKWLEQRGLSLADFSDYFARAQWALEMRGKVKAPQIPVVSASAEQRDLLAAELTLSGELDRMANRLAWRVVAMAKGEQGEKDACRSAQRDLFFKRAGLSAGLVADWLHGLGREESWLGEMASMEANYRDECTRVLTTSQREREMTSLRLPLTRFDVEMIELESRDAAREAFMCVRDDGMSMSEVAREGQYPFHQTEMVLEQISDDLQQKFLSLTPGSLLEPTPREDGFLLTKILDKKEPSLDEPEVLERVDRRILERHFTELSSGRIQWRIVAILSEE